MAVKTHLEVPNIYGDYSFVYIYTTVTCEEYLVMRGIFDTTSCYMFIKCKFLIDKCISGLIFCSSTVKHKYYTHIHLVKIPQIVQCVLCFRSPDE